MTEDVEKMIDNLGAWVVVLLAVQVMQVVALIAAVSAYIGLRDRMDALEKARAPVPAVRAEKEGR